MATATPVFHPFQRVLTIALFAVVAFSFFFNNIAKQMFAPPELFSDYQSYHFAAETLRDGEDPYDVQNLVTRAEAVDHQLAISVPPYRHALLELLPVVGLTYLDYGDAKRVWIVLIGVSVFVCVWLLMKYFLPWKTFDPPSLITGSLVLLFAPLVYSMTIHQINTVLLALMFLGILAFRKKKIVIAALLFALAIQSKFFVGAIILALIFLRQYKIAGLTLLFSVVLFGMPFLFFSGTFSGYTEHVAGQLIGGEVIDNPLNPVQGAGTVSHFKNMSLTGEAARLFTQQETVTPLIVLPSIDWITWLGRVAFLVVLGLLFVDSRKKQFQEEQALLMFTGIILVLWFVLASPISWQHHLVLLVLLLPWFLHRAETLVTVRWVGALLLLGVLGSSIIASPPAGSAHVIRHLFALTPFVGLILIMVVSWVLYRRLERQAAP